ncbi:GntR family transcriptional regulator [Blastopirellula marina]|nr:GntR family transcriptional regulator [Blastopirellula marina]
MATIHSLQETGSISGSLRMDIFTQILLAIFQGEFPPGARLKVQHVAAQFGVSSTPVREAFVELVGLGVIEMVPNRGATVSPFGVKEVREIYHIRRLLEVEAVRCACDCADLKPLQQIQQDTIALQSAYRDKDWGIRCLELDRLTHQAIEEASGVKRLATEINRYNRLVHMMRLLLRHQDKYLDPVLSEHLTFFEPLLRRDKEAAGQKMALHIDATCERVVEGIFSSDRAEN